MSDGDPIQVGADAEVGSPRLAAALAAGDADGIARALRLDVVIIPLLRGEAGDPRIRVFQSAEHEDGRFRLALFSSVPALAAFLAGDEERGFDVRRGADLIPFLTQNRELLEGVVFDPAGPHAVGAPVDAVIAALQPRDDDLVEWIVDGP